MKTEQIKVETIIAAPVEDVWHAYNSPDHIIRWNFASDEWCCPRAKADLQPGGRLTSRMEAKDGSMGFDFGGTYEAVVPQEAITLVLDDGRKVLTTFTEAEEGTTVTTTFDPENQNPAEMQRDGWQAILDNFKAHVESGSAAGSVQA